MKTVISLIVSHNYRLRCLLKQLIDKQLHIFNYKNCAIIELTLQKRNNNVLYSLSMVYEGELSESKPRQYFSIDNFPTIINMKESVLDINSSQLSEDTLYVFYLVRHGEAEHNLYTTLEKVKSPFNIDTSLTKTGFKQALHAGEFLYTYLKPRNYKIDYLCSSDLKRTWQTLSTLLTGLPKSYTKRKRIAILPCAHELMYRIEGSCDKHMIRDMRGFAGENRTSCGTNNTEKNCQLIKKGTVEYILDWSHYNKFYDNEGRNMVYFTESKYTCTDTNMIKNCLSLIIKM